MIYTFFINCRILLLYIDDILVKKKKKKKTKEMKQTIIYNVSHPPTSAVEYNRRVI